MERKLQLKQQKFVDAYLGEANGNATEAARLAGYAGNDNTLRVVGHQNLTNPNIRAEIARILAANCLSREEILSRLTDQALGVGEFLKADEAGEVSVDFAAMRKAGKMHLIHSIRVNKFGQNIEFYDAQAALVHLGRYHVLFTDKQDATVNGGLRVQSETIILRPGETDVDRDA